ncbi:glycosyltransferase family A protein [Rothia uropygialis]|uniref:glycosyltransferase family A protein n=1 Tax=Kocuria sp. 36 TaxID=1415402 RepID=UPI00101BB863|nr:glycosyltransferase family A protein [Kocuria sp. 36]
MTSSLAASVDIPTRGGKNRLHCLLDALKNQTCSEFEAIVILVDDIDATKIIFRTTSSTESTTSGITSSKATRNGRKPPTRGLNRHEEESSSVVSTSPEPRMELMERHGAAHEDPRISSVTGLTADHCPDGLYAIDSFLPFVPHTVGRRPVALCVEAAGLSGIRYPERAREIF